MHELGAGHPTGGGKVGLAGQQVSSREVAGDSEEVGRQARCIIAQPGHRKSPARGTGLSRGTSNGGLPPVPRPMHQRQTQ